MLVHYLRGCGKKDRGYSNYSHPPIIDQETENRARTKSGDKLQRPASGTRQVSLLKGSTASIQSHQLQTTY